MLRIAFSQVDRECLKEKQLPTVMLDELRCVMRLSEC